MSLSKTQGRYYLKPADIEIRKNLLKLKDAVEEAGLAGLTTTIARLEQVNKLRLPTTNGNINEICACISISLNLVVNITGVTFSDDNFSISLGGNPNYFLVEDLTQIANQDLANITGTAISGFDRNLRVDGETHEQGGEQLYFPFKYDKSQLSTLANINNIASTIQGPPGTGKSETICNLLCHLAATGKKVSMVSQKPKAVQVVKDKLNKLGLKYLYAYIPNLEKANQQDTADGLATQLEQLAQYNTQIQQIPEHQELVPHLESFNQTLENERKFAENYKKQIELSDKLSKVLLPKINNLEIEILDLAKYKQNFTTTSNLQLYITIAQIHDLQNKINIIDDGKEIDENNEFTYTKYHQTYLQTTQIIAQTVDLKSKMDGITNGEETILDIGFSDTKYQQTYLQTVNTIGQIEDLQLKFEDLKNSLKIEPGGKFANSIYHQTCLKISNTIAQIEDLQGKIASLENGLKTDIESKFIDTIYHQTYLQTVNTIGQIEDLHDKIKKLDFENNPLRATFDIPFPVVDFGKYADEEYLDKHLKNIKIVADCFEKTGYDGKFMPWVKTNWFNITFFNIGDYFNKLDGQVKEQIEKAVLSTNYKSHKLQEIAMCSNFYNYFKESIALKKLILEKQAGIDKLNQYLPMLETAKTAGVEMLKTQLQNLKITKTEGLNFCGLSLKGFSVIVKQMDGLSIDNFHQDFEEFKQYNVDVEQAKQDLKFLNTAIQNYQNANKFNSLNLLTAKIKDTKTNRQDTIKKYIQNLIDQRIQAELDRPDANGIMANINILASSLKKSRKAFATFNKVKNENPEQFKTALKLIPIWIMELEAASRIIPLETEVFDYLIVDEASQCNIAYTLPAMYRAKHVIFVGDNKQMRTELVFTTNEALANLATQYKIPPVYQIKEAESAVKSVLDIAHLVGIKQSYLNYHYRSPNELIGFSNQHFYNNQLISANHNYLGNTTTKVHRLCTKQDTKDHIADDKTIVIKVQDQEINDKTNLAEANYILQMFKKIRTEGNYRDKSVGILTFLQDQSKLIRKVFATAGLDEARDNFIISTIDGIQGDEKDIIIYSFIIRDTSGKSSYNRITGENGPIIQEINAGRVNVAFTRAKLQAHSVISMPVADFPEGIWIKKYLEYATQTQQKHIGHNNELAEFDSYFEEEFYNHLRVKFKEGYLIQNQVRSCGYKIDFVLTNTTNGKKLAIECDGPVHYKDKVDEQNGQLIESDIYRQQILESAGWVFYRLKYSDWIKADNIDQNRTNFLAEITELINEL